MKKNIPLRIILGKFLWKNPMIWLSGNLIVNALLMADTTWYTITVTVLKPMPNMLQISRGDPPDKYRNVIPIRISDEINPLGDFCWLLDGRYGCRISTKFLKQIWFILNVFLNWILFHVLSSMATVLRVRCRNRLCRKSDLRLSHRVLAISMRLFNLFKCKQAIKNSSSSSDSES